MQKTKTTRSLASKRTELDFDSNEATMKYFTPIDELRLPVVTTTATRGEATWPDRP